MNINADFFEALYQQNSDPWRFASNHYELTRYQRICDVIQYKKYHRIFEPGCSIGILTKKLASLAEFVDAIDISPTAASLAQSQCSSLSNVLIHCNSLTNYSIHPRTDLIIFSEIGYYFEREEWKKIIINLLETCVSPFGLLASHWLGVSKDHVLSGDEVHSIIHSFNEFQLEHHERHSHFLLDYWRRK